MNRKNIAIDSTTNEIVGIIEDDYEKGVFGGSELVLQEFMIKKNVLLSLYSLDTIFCSEAIKQNIHGTFIINRINPQTGKILETTDPLRRGTLHGAKASEVIPIRVDGSEAKGFGLGLAYVKSVAGAHGGTVNLYSKKGEGTKFELFIPF